MTRIRVQYFGPLRELSGCDEELVDTRASLPLDLYDELRERYHFSLLPEQIMIAVNERLARRHAPLQENDCVVFIPPIAGC